MKEEDLISAGFSKFYDYKIKEKRKNFLRWSNLFKP